MDVTCPHCAAAYRVPDSLLKPGKKLRCAACKADWAPIAAPPEPPPAPPPPPAPMPAPAVAPAAAAPPPDLAPPPPPALPEPPPARPLVPREDAEPPPPLMPVADPRRIRQAHEGGRADSRRLLPLAWMASLAAVAALVGGLLVYRAPIAAAWPPFARVGQVIGGL